MHRMIGKTAAFAALAMAYVPALAADDYDRRVTVRNESRQAIHYLYASPVTSSSWEEDLLGEGIIAAGDSIVANIDNGTEECRYDFKVVMDDKREHVLRGEDVCRISTVTVTDSGASAD